MTRRVLRSLAAVLATIAAGLTGCSYASSGGGGQIVVCGTTLYNEAGGPVPVLFPPSLRRFALNDSDRLYLQVAPGCAHGSQVAWVPRSAARLVGAAYASDGLAAAVVLVPTRPYTEYRLIATSHGRVIDSYIVNPSG